MCCTLSVHLYSQACSLPVPLSRTIAVNAAQVRSWRIICIYCTTYSWRLKKTSPLIRVTRDDWWMIRRVLVILLPTLVMWLLLLWSTVVDYVNTAYTILMLVILLALSVRIISLWRVMEAKLLLEAKWLLSLTAVFLVYYIWKNVYYYELSTLDDGDWLPALSFCLQTALLDIMYAVTMAMWLHQPSCGASDRLRGVFSDGREDFGRMGTFVSRGVRPGSKVSFTPTNSTLASTATTVTLGPAAVYYPSKVDSAKFSKPRQAVQSDGESSVDGMPLSVRCFLCMARHASTRLVYARKCWACSMRPHRLQLGTLSEWPPRVRESRR